MTDRGDRRQRLGEPQKTDGQDRKMFGIYKSLAAVNHERSNSKTKTEVRVEWPAMEDSIPRDLQQAYSSIPDQGDQSSDRQEQP